MANDELFPGLKTRYILPDISWQFYKHWGQGYLAGEGILIRNGDRSGCLEEINGRQYASPPIVVQARLYESSKGKISAVYSYPHGIGAEASYFWEIFGVNGTYTEVERYATEAEMEARIIALLSEQKVEAI